MGGEESRVEQRGGEGDTAGRWRGAGGVADGGTGRPLGSREGHPRRWERRGGGEGWEGSIVEEGEAVVRQSRWTS